MEGISSQAFVLGMSALGAGVAMSGAIGAGAGIGFAAGKGAEAVGRQPEARGAVMSTMLIGCAIAETNSIYALVVALILLFANPLAALVK